MREDTGFFDHFDIGRSTAVADGWFVGVHFDNGIVDAHCAEGRQHMLDRVHPDRAFTDRRSALNRFQIGDVRVNRRFIRQILALEFDPVIDRRR